MKLGVLGFILIFFAGCSSLRVQDGRISRYFTAREAVYSDTGTYYGIGNTAKGKKKRNILYAAKRMDQVREALGEPIFVTGWYRNSKINKKVGGAPNSSHLLGLAVDFRIKGRADLVHKKLKARKISYDLLIYYPRQNRIHIGFKEKIKEERNEYRIM